MKKLLIMLLTTVLLLSSLTVTAFAADKASLPTTISFLNACGAGNVIYTYRGTTDDGAEQVRISYNDDFYDSIVCNLYFADNGKHVQIFAWNLVNVTAGKNYAYQVCNKLNYDYKWVKFYLDETDNTITCQWDAVITPDSGEAVLEMVKRMVAVISDDDVIAEMTKLQ